MSTTTQYQPYYPDGVYMLELEDTKLRVRIEHDRVVRVAKRHGISESVCQIEVRDGEMGVDLGTHWVPMRWIWRLIGASFGSPK